MLEYDTQLLKDIKEGRTETIEKMVLEAFSDYTDLCVSQTAKYFDLMYEFGVQDGLHLANM